MIYYSNSLIVFTVIIRIMSCLNLKTVLLLLLPFVAVVEARPEETKAVTQTNFAADDIVTVKNKRKRKLFDTIDDNAERVQAEDEEGDPR